MRRYWRAGEGLRGEVGGVPGARWAWRLWRWHEANHMELLGGRKGGAGLGGALLGVPQFRDGLGESGQPDDHDRPLIGAVPADVGVGGHDAGGLAELVARLGGPGDAAEGLAGVGRR